MHTLLTCFCKPDLDTVLAAWLYGHRASFSGYGKVLALPSTASAPLLASARVLCLECGGSGLVQLHNFDHHGKDILPCASEQVWQLMGCPAKLHELVHYVACIDTAKPYAVPEGALPLSALFSGMLLCEATPLRRFRAGLALLDRLEHSGLPPHDVRPLLHSPAMAHYAAAKVALQHKLQEALSYAHQTTLGRLRVMCLQADMPGVHGLLRRNGAHISLAGTGRPVRWSLSVEAGLEWLLRAALPLLCTRETGWGGPAGGSIICSPRHGSRLSEDDILSCLRAALAQHTGTEQ